MKFFRTYEAAIATRNANAAADPEWHYIIHLATTPRTERNVWLIEVRDEDYTLLGCL